MTNTPSAKRTGNADGAAEEDERPAKRIGSIHDFDNMVTVLVGKEEKRFTLQQDAVCAKSKFFRAACSKEWLEGHERVVRLPETGNTTFHDYCTWIYSGEIADGTSTPASAYVKKCSEFWRLIKLHILGDKIDDIQLRNKANIELFKSMKRVESVPNAQCLKVSNGFTVSFRMTTGIRRWMTD